MSKRNKFIVALIAALCLFAPNTFASTSCNYPTTLDSWTDKIAGDFLTIADVNQFRCGIERLETGPLRPNDGSAAAPAYAFRTSATAGLFLSAANQIDLSTGGTARWRWNSSGHMLPIADNTYDIGSGSFRVRDLFVGRNSNFGSRMLVATSQTTGSGANDVVLSNGSALRFVTADGTTSLESKINTNASNDMLFSRPASGNIYNFLWNAISHIQFDAANGGGVIRINTESTLAPTVLASGMAFYTDDNGSGKTRLWVQFSTGSPVLLATQP